MKRIISIIFVLAIAAQLVSAQGFRVKTNLLYTGATLTPNLGAEIQLNNRMSLDFRGSYNPWNLNGNANNNKKAVHWMSQVELRYWPRQQREPVSTYRSGYNRFRGFDKHFFGIHLIASQYNISRWNMDLLLGKDSEKYRYQGYAIGAGVSYGYQWVFGRNWRLEANIGIGAISLDHDIYECRECGNLTGSERKTYVGPTRLGINIVYAIR